MVKKKEEVILDKKTKEKLSKEILLEIENDVKPQLIEDVVDSVKNSFDDEYKNGLKTQISEELIGDIKDNIKKDQAKLSRRKSFKIVRMYIYILVLIAFSGFLCYRLYETGNLNIFTLKKQDSPKVTEPITTSLVKNFDWYNKKYGYLMDLVHISNYELLKGTYNLKDIDITDRLAMAYLTLADSDIIKENTIYTINEEIIIDAYIKVFGTDEGYRNGNFRVNGLSYVYSTSSKNYIAISEEGEVKNEYIANTIINIEESGNNLIFTAIVGLVKDDNLYNVFYPEKKLGTYQTGNSLVIYDKQLSKVEYIFAKNGDNYYISAITKK